MKLDKWTQQLHDKLAEHETAAPDNLWADIEAALPQQKGRGRLVALRRWTTAAAVVTLMIGGALVWWGQQQPTQMLSQAEEPMPNSETLAAEAQEESTDEVGPHRPYNTYKPHKTHRAHQLQKSHQLQKPQEYHEPQQPHEPHHLSDADSAPDETVPADDAVHTAVATTHAVRRTPRAGRRFTLGLYANNGLGSHDNSNAVFMDQAMAKTYSSSYTQSASRQAPVYLAGYEERQHHSQPLSLGLSFDLQLNRRLSLTSGVVYTRLNSEFIQYIRSQQYSKQQTLHYVGIPLGLSYTVWQHNHFQAYLRAAAQADWNIHAKTVTEGVEQQTNRDRVQWSVSGSLGVQYEVVPRLSLYAEPGISHYFDNGSSVQNFFKDKPTSLKLEAGIRLSLK